MKRMLTIARRELDCLWFSPVGYVVVGLFALIASSLFFQVFQTGAQASFRDVNKFMVFYVMWFVVPAISMRLISEEFRAGTIEMLATSPISDTQIVCGKWVGAMAFYVGMVLLVFGVLAAVLFANASPDVGPMITQLIGLLLVGGLYLAIGITASAISGSQVIAFLITAAMIFLLTIGMQLLASIDAIPEWLRQSMFYVRVDTYFEEFNKGIIDTGALIYFISTIVMFLFIAVKLLESRRWR